MPYEWTDLSGIRAQIISNTTIAVPHLTGDYDPANDINPNYRYNIIVRHVSEENYEASVVYGKYPNFFATGVGKSDRRALLNLLETTYRIIGDLYQDNELRPLDPKTAKVVLKEGKGAYDTQPAL